MFAVRCTAALLLFCGLAFAQAAWKVPQRNSVALIEPKAVVARYCQMDSDGFRLDSEKAKRFQEVTTWKSTPPVMRFAVISQLAIAAPKQSGESLHVTVSYTVLGTYVPGAGYSPDPHTETVEYELVQDGSVWKIVDSDDLSLPRIHRARAYKWLKEQIAIAKDRESRTQLEDAARQLQP